MNEELKNEEVKNTPGAPTSMPEGGAAAMDERLRALEQREQALALRERQARCREALRGRELPDALIDCLDLSSDERADETLDILTSVFTDALAQRVKARLGAEPPRAGSKAPDPLTAIRKAMGLN